MKNKKGFELWHKLTVWFVFLSSIPYFLWNMIVLVSFVALFSGYIMGVDINAKLTVLSFIYTFIQTILFGCLMVLSKQMINKNRALHKEEQENVKRK